MTKDAYFVDCDDEKLSILLFVHEKKCSKLLQCKFIILSLFLHLSAEIIWIIYMYVV